MEFTWSVQQCLNEPAHESKFVYNSRTFQGLLKASAMVFKDYKFMKILNYTQKCENGIMKKLV